MNILLPLILAQVGVAPAGTPVLKMDAQLNAQPGKIFMVKVETNLRYRKWTIPDGLSRVPPEMTRYGEDAFVGYGPAGVYEFKLEGTFQDQFAEAKCIVFVGSLPGPPVPKPPVNDPLVAELQKAYLVDGKRPEIRDRLVKLWLDASADVVDNEDYKTFENFRQAMHRAAENHPYKLVATDLADARSLMGAELKALCGGSEVCPLGAAKSDLRGKVKAVLERYAGALGACK